MTEFHGLPTANIENEHVRLEYFTSAGPRIVGLSFQGSPNLLADGKDASFDSPYGKFFFHGGHRLWASPESAKKTYIPDNTGLVVSQVPGGVELSGATEPGSGIHKSMRVELVAGRAAVRLTHSIVNENSEPVTLAPWAITMFRQGGTVILPQPTGNSDPDGFLSNRLLVIWPYTHINDARIELRDDFTMIHAQPALPPLKIGYANQAGWLAYWVGGILFRKSFELHAGASLPDNGCNTEVYCNDQMVELETLGVLGELAPGKSVTHTESWELFAGLDAPFVSAELRELLSRV